MEALNLIKYRDAGMNTYTYFWVNEKNSIQSPYFDSADDAMRWLPSPTEIQDARNEDDEFARISREEGLVKASTYMSDKGYQLSTHEKQAEFAKKRK